MRPTEHSIESFSHEAASYAPSEDFRAQAHISSRTDDERFYRESVDSPETFYERELTKLPLRKHEDRLVDWKIPHSQWFLNARLTVAEGGFDPHLEGERKTGRRSFRRANQVKG